MYTTTLAKALLGPPTAVSVVGGVLYCFAQFGSLDMSTGLAFGKTPSYLTCPVTTLLGATAAPPSPASEEEPLKALLRSSGKPSSGIATDTMCIARTPDDLDGRIFFVIATVVEELARNWSDTWTGPRAGAWSNATQTIEDKTVASDRRCATANS
jgi:hypothetical protein